MNKTVAKATSGILLAVVLTLYLFIFNEARKEIYFLCGNFQPLVKEASVIRQLDTGTFLRYHRDDTQVPHSITVDSSVHFGYYRCHIQFDQQGLVSASGFSPQ